MHNHIPSINIDTTVPLPHLNTRGLSSPVSTTPLTPGFVSPSQPGYSSSPSLLAVTPPTPAVTLGPTHDTFPVFSPSTPVSPFGFQQPPWPIPKPVRPFLISSQLKPDWSLTHRVHLPSQQSISFLLAIINGAPWYHRSGTNHTPRATGVAMLTKSTWSHQSTSTCKNPTRKGFR